MTNSDHTTHTTHAENIVEAIMRDAILTSLDPSVSKACPRYVVQRTTTIVYEVDFKPSRGVHGAWYIQPKGKPPVHAIYSDVVAVIADDLRATIGGEG